ncbi:MAG: site-specific integrase [Bdellovibrionales bacterium]|nr:site-specific integrase [Bdellovibrionales bacterium]
MKKKEVKVKNQPGIYKVLRFGPAKYKWVDTGRYRALRRINGANGKPKKDQAVFDNFEDAQAFRRGAIPKPGAPVLGRSQLGSMFSHQDERASGARGAGFTFRQLVDEWKAFHYLQIDYATKQTYDKRLPHLEVMMDVPVESLTPESMDQLVKYWVKDHPKKRKRHNFDKELDLIKVVLNFYRRRKNPQFVIPIFTEHYKAAQLIRGAMQPVRSLTQKDLSRFLKALKEQKNPLYFPLALTQFCLGLRIGEACGLHWKDIDLENKIIKIESTIVWDHENWQPRIKPSPKNGKARILVLPDVLIHELAILKAKRTFQTDLVFHHDDGTPLIRKSIGQAYNRTLKLIGVDYVRGTHLLRKTSATQANRVTGDFYAVSRLLDHSTPDVTMRYVEEVDDQKRKVAEALNQVAKAALAEQPSPEGAAAKANDAVAMSEKESSCAEVKDASVPQNPPAQVLSIFDFQKLRKINGNRRFGLLILQSRARVLAVAARVRLRSKSAGLHPLGEAQHESFS